MDSPLNKHVGFYRSIVTVPRVIPGILLVTALWSQPGLAQLPQFKDVAREVGLTTSHISTPDKRYILETMSGGVGLIDCGNTGKLDIIVTNGSTVEGFRRGGDPMITLYHQEDGFKFTDITQAAGLTRKGWGMGVAVADFDNDGLPDIYVTGYGGNALYHNLGNCRFQDATAKAGVGAGEFSTGAAWADYDRDGYADLFVSRYVHLDINKLPAFGSNEKSCRFKGIRVFCGPWGLPGESDLLFHNRGDGTFEEVSRKAGVDNPDRYYGLGVEWGDYDDDGWPDLYVANYSGPNYLFHNKHDGTFEDVGMLAGAAVSGDGLQEGSMGVDWGDYMRDGHIGIFVTNFTEQSSALYRNLGKGEFSDVTSPAKLAAPTYYNVGWGAGFMDFSNTGWLDLFQANGNTYPQMDQITGGTPYALPMQLFRNQGTGAFSDISSVLAGIPDASRRGAAFGDLNNDGNMDIVVVTLDGPPLVLLNQGGNHNHRLLLRLVGTKSNKMAVGSVVTVTFGSLVQKDLVQKAEVRAGGSYLSSSDPRLHFGLGTETTAREIAISWPSGYREVLHDVPADFIFTVTEGKGIVSRLPFPPPL